MTGSGSPAGESNDPPSVWAEALAAEALLEALRDGNDEIDANTIMRLRKTWRADVVHAAIELTRAERKLDRKFGAGHGFIGDLSGVEQASGPVASAYKAQRIAAWNPSTIYDGGCGIGADLAAFVSHAPTRGVDSDPLRVFCARRNVPNARVDHMSIESLLDEVRALPGAQRATIAGHLDPGRRSEADGSRRFALADHVPDPTVWRAWLDVIPRTVIKLGPGADEAEIKTAIGRDASIEWIAEGERLVQTLVWCGDADSAPRTAVILPPTLAGVPACLSRDKEIRRPPSLQDEPIESPDVLIGLHPVAERAQLSPEAVGTIQSDIVETGSVREAAFGLGVYLARRASARSTKISEARPTSWCRVASIHAVLPPRLDQISRRLGELDAGEVTVRTRDRAVNADTWTRRLRGRGDRPLDVHAYRLREKIVVWITDPWPSWGSSRL